MRGPRRSSLVNVSRHRLLQCSCRSSALRASIVAFVLLLSQAMSAEPKRTPQAQPGLPATPGTNVLRASTGREGYVGTEACRACHQQEGVGYTGSAHQLASSEPSKTSLKGNFLPGHNVLRTSNRYLSFAMEQKGEYFVQTAVIDLPLSDILSRSERIDIVVGSGRKGQTYLSWKEDRLVELPVSFWSETNRWINSPGYTDGLPNFDKAVLPRCLECHASYLQPAPPPANRFTRDVVDLGLSCETCHGPGAAHVALHQSSKPPSHGEPQAILNPASFSRSGQMSLCSLCHAGPGVPLRPAFTFKPGEDIRRYLTLSTQTDAQNLDVHGSQVQLLESSRCFQAGTMTCSTCHNVHRIQRDAAAFKQSCLSCHKPEACSRTRIATDHDDGDCIACHMPLQQTNQIVFDDAGSAVKPRIRTHRIAIYGREQAPVQLRSLQP